MIYSLNDKKMQIGLLILQDSCFYGDFNDILEFFSGTEDREKIH